MITFKDTTAIGIKTKLIPATHTRPPRIKASTISKSPSTGKPVTLTVPIHDFQWDGFKNLSASVAKELHYDLGKTFGWHPDITHCKHIAYVQYVEDSEYIFLFGSE